jgi:excisionase family DNA binding protein
MLAGMAKTETKTAPPNRAQRRHPNKQMPDPAAYSVIQAGAALGVSRQVIYSLIQGGQLRTVMAGRRRLIPATEVDRFLTGAA